MKILLLCGWCVVMVVAMKPVMFYRKQPFGPKMCQELCREISGDFAPSFTVSNLTCDVDKPADVQDKQILQDNNIQDEETCPPHTRTIKARANKIICAQSVVLDKRTPGTNRHESADAAFPSLLFPEFNISSGVIRQLFLHNNSMVNYSLSLKNVLAVAFMNSNRKLFISSVPRKLVYSDLDSSSLKLFAYCSPFALAVDDERQLVFHMTKDFLCKSAMRGRIDRLFKTADSKLLAVDQKRKMVFTATKSCLYFTTYEGRGKKKFHYGGFKAVTIDPVQSILYHASDKAVKRMSTSRSGMDSRLYAQIPYRIGSMVSFGHRLYITSLNYGNIGYLDLNVDEPETKILQEKSLSGENRAYLCTVIA